VALHAVGYAWLASATLNDALTRLARYARVLNDFWRPALGDEPRGIRFTLGYATAHSVRPLSRHDAVLSGIVKLCRITYGDSFTPLEVAVEREPPNGAQRFQDWFRAPIVWRASQPSLLFRREDLTRPLVTTNPGLVLAAEKLVTDYLARLDRDDVVARVKRELLNGFPDGAPTQAVIARALGLSTRTLHRRLAEAGTSFDDLLDETRRELAAGYIRHTDYSVGEVAFLLGFAEASSFNRAFRRWTGMSPSEFRRAETELGAAAVA
jgi:AraC-like DNA-binding protein